MTTLKKYRKWKLRKFKDTSRIRMPRTWTAYHRETGYNVGSWRDKGEARRWVRKTGVAWRQEKGIDGPSGWDIRPNKVQYSIC